MLDARQPTTMTKIKRHADTLWGRILLCTIAGCLQFLGTPTYNCWFLSWIGFIPLFFVLTRASPRQAFFYGWFAGWVGHLGGYYWIGELLVRFGHLPEYIAFILSLAFAAYQGFHWSLLGYGISRCRRKHPALPIALTAPIFLAAGELLMPLIFDGYLAISQAWIVPVIQVADLTGPIGVTFLITMVNGALFDALESKVEHEAFRWRSVAVTAATLALVLCYGALRIHQVTGARANAEKIKVGVVQGNVGIMEKGQQGLSQQHHQLHLNLSRQLQDKGADLIIWPESAYPYAIDRSRSEDFPPHDRRRLLQGFNIPLIFGVLTYTRNEPYPYNSAYMLDANGKIVGRFDKNHLLIFGEYIPFYKTIPQFKTWFPATSHFSAGTDVTTFPFRNYRIGPLICYEDIIPAFTRRLAKRKPNLLVNLTNDAWFGLSAAPWQHFALSVYRSVEHRLDLVRSVNTGVSAVVDATGRVQAQTSVYDPVVQGNVPPVTLFEEVALMDPPTTVYAKVGDLFGYLNLLAVLLLLFWRRKK